MKAGREAGFPFGLAPRDAGIIMFAVSYERSARFYDLFGAKDDGASLAAGDEQAVYVLQ